ncbi:hypothetical protein MKEN_00404500 [Mycena kentingensis (nom. inval.)]|nr:hypothetical protein MKEN_00404500 [Mycena kentingensis (nom. inval.)]
MSTTRLVERTSSGLIREVEIHPKALAVKIATRSNPSTSRRIGLYASLVEPSKKVFLPAGYPESVSPDYLRYQIFNACQAFCSSLAGLLASRAVLEGFGVGNADASATNAILLTVLQDIFGRMTTIVAAYALGPSLGAEAKVYRLLADITNDVAVILDVVSPLLLNWSTAPQYARVAALCLAGSMRAICGICAGGAKAALAMHFATPAGKTAGGDVGDLNAKDASKETVLGLFGMLTGSLVMRYLTTPRSTNTALLTLVGLHLFLNYLGIRGVVLRTLNRQRLTIAWTRYRDSLGTDVPNQTRNLSPEAIARAERVLFSPWETLFGGISGVGTKTRVCFGASLVDALRVPANLKTPVPIPEILDVLAQERYLIFLHGHGHGWISVYLCLRAGYTPADLLKAWVHAVEIARLPLASSQFKSESVGYTELEGIKAAYEKVNELLPGFVERMRGVGWDLESSSVSGGLLVGSPSGLVESTSGGSGTGRKEP